MDQHLEQEIDRLASEIERLKTEGDPEGRIADLNAYMRVLYLKLSMSLQAGQWPWAPKADDEKP
jgi:hypothetical protein